MIKTCPLCKAEMQYISDKKYWVCPTCGEVIFYYEKLT